MNKIITVRREVLVTLTGIDIMKLLIDAGIVPPTNGIEPEVTFKVPSGADWSGMKIDVTAADPISVSFVLETDDENHQV